MGDTVMHVSEAAWNYVIRWMLSEYRTIAETYYEARFELEAVLHSLQLE